MNILVLAEPSAHMHPYTPRLVAAAKTLGTVSVMVAGFQLDASIKELSSLTQVKELLVIDNPNLHGLPAENLAPLVVSLASDFTHIFAAASTFGANVLPRIAALLNRPMLSNVSTILDPLTFVRPIHAGNALATIQVKNHPVCLTLRPAGFIPVETHSKPQTPLRHIQLTNTQTQSLSCSPSRFLDSIPSPGKRPELSTARIVVAGGQGLEKQGSFSLIHELADEMGAAIGATRSAVDAQLAPSDWQIGQTGRIIAPDLYIGIGISGAIQHLAGIKDAKTIVAINKDPNAPLFSVADLSLEADLYTAVPELVQALRDKTSDSF